MMPDQDAAFAAARDQTLLDGLALSPAERLQLAESLWLDIAPTLPIRLPFTMSFTTLAQFYAWQDAGGDFGRVVSRSPALDVKAE
ncbi:MAG: hypothetical protein ABI542_01900 [Gemmatimonadota bacterium]